MTEDHITHDEWLTRNDKLRAEQHAETGLRKAAWRASVRTFWQTLAGSAAPLTIGTQVLTWGDLAAQGASLALGLAVAVSSSLLAAGVAWAQMLGGVPAEYDV